MNIETILWLIPLPPLAAFVLIILLTKHNKGLSHSLAIGAASLSWLAGMLIFWQAVQQPDLAHHPLAAAINWLPVGSGWLQIGVLLDPLTAVGLFFVAWTVLMIFIYSTGYHNFGSPKGDKDVPGLPPQGAELRDEHGHIQRVPSIEPLYSRFFAFISLFAFAMFALVVTDNLLVLYIAWEIMGLCSYLLIGFWYGKPTARDAAVKAFLVTRIGDMLMLLGLAALYTLTGSLNFRGILANEAVLSQLAATASPVLGLTWAGLIGLLLLAGTVGKSAQFPLHVWLPDAMEGPTPVSAMIHAATMVSAGVFLAARFFPLFSAGWAVGQPLPPAMQAMAWIGSATALLAATMALTQKDIKRVLAYSTISQLGYMVAALGIGAYGAAVFHLFTHAFFKALLFLGSGAVIHGMEHGSLHSGAEIDNQDMANMGGLWKKMPVTFATFVAGGLALSGFPLLTSGFWSKDAILSGAYSNGFMVVFGVLALSALLTAFYTARQITLTFLGPARTPSAGHATEALPVMTVPLVVLSIFAVAAGWVGIPAEFPVLGGAASDWFGGFLAGGEAVHAPVEAAHSLVPLLVSIAVSLLGLAGGWAVYRSVKAGDADPLRKALGPLYAFFQQGYYLDQAYNTLFVRPAAWLAEVFTSRWIDQVFLDGILHGIGRLGMVIGRFARNGIDLPVFNRFLGDTIGSGTRRLGSELKVTQSGRVQQYMVVSVLLVVAAGLVVIYLLARL